MILLLFALYVVSTLLVVPGSLLAGRKRPADVIPMLLPFVGLGTWTLLTLFGVGHQGLTHIVEAVAVSGAAVTLAYVRLFVAHRVPLSYAAVVFPGIAVAVAIGARLLTPEIPQ